MNKIKYIAVNENITNIDNLRYILSSYDGRYKVYGKLPSEITNNERNSFRELKSILDQIIDSIHNNWWSNE